MPELPEVEIWRENLERWLHRRRIRSASVPDALLRGKQSRREVETGLTGATVSGVGRRGKFLVLDLGRSRRGLLVHLGMTGSFARVGANAELPRFTRASLELARGERLAFVDARRFGEFRLIGDKERERLDALGVEPLEPGFTASRFHELAQASSRPIKVLLMDQKRVAGIGNIHAAEALYMAGIHPERRAASLSHDESARLVRAIRRELRCEIARSRSENLRYLQQGEVNRFRVYGRADEPCPKCKARFAKLVQGGRSTYFCPRCQPKRT